MNRILKGDNLKTNSYYGFPPEYYKVEYPNIGSPELASQIIGLLQNAGIKAEGVKRGLDHGVYVGFSVGEFPHHLSTNLPTYTS